MCIPLEYYSVHKRIRRTGKYFLIEHGMSLQYFAAIVSLSLFYFTITDSKHIKSNYIMGTLRAAWRGMKFCEFMGDINQQGGAFVLGPGKCHEVIVCCLPVKFDEDTFCLNVVIAEISQNLVVLD